MCLSDIMVQSKSRLDYALSDNYKSMFSDIFSLLNGYGYKLFLFGSFSRGTVSPKSDVDLLLIVPNIRLIPRMKKELKNRFDDQLIDIMVNHGKEIDLKVYGELDFIESSKVNYFEGSIIQDLILLEDVINGR